MSCTWPQHPHPQANTSPGIFNTSSNVTSSSHGLLHAHMPSHTNHTLLPPSLKPYKFTPCISTWPACSKCTQYSAHRSLPLPTHIIRIHITNKTLHHSPCPAGWPGHHPQAVSLRTPHVPPMMPPSEGSHRPVRRNDIS